MTSTKLSERFEKLFGARPGVFRAPGRVNLIGEHTDYNDGFVMPCAIGTATSVAISPRSDRKLVVQSKQFPQSAEVDIDRLPARGSKVWSDYVVGVAAMLHEKGCHLQGANLLVQGNVPIGAGLSSSAALEVATALALLSLSETSLTMPEVAKLCQRTENVFIGAQVGIMDQFISCLGKAEHALLLDCRSLEFELVPIPDDLSLVICNTMVKHEHASGEYNDRRRECEEGVRLLKDFYPTIRALRDLTAEQLHSHAQDLPPLIYKRCCHVVDENQRVLSAAKFLTAADLSAVARLMRESHRSLRDLYQVSCPELDTMVEVAEGLPGYHGGRMTGGGFGGCTVNLVERSHAPSFAEQISEGYRRVRGIKPDVYICSAADGAGREEN